LRAQVEYLVIDPPRMLNEMTISALDAADDLILLMTLDVPAIRSAKRALDIFTRLGYERGRVKVVANRYTNMPEFDLKQVSKVVETDVFATISNDYQSAISSINVGEPLVLSKTQSRIMHDFGNLASKLSGIRPPSEAPDQRQRQNRSGWSALFGGK